MPKDVVVIGAGGFGRETLDVIESINAAASESLWNVVGVIDDGPSAEQLERLSVRGYDYLGALSDSRAVLATAQCAIGIGSPAVRSRIATLVAGLGGHAAVLVHPSAVIGSQVEIQSGSVVCAGVQLSTNTRIGRYVHLNPGAIIGHDTVLDDFVSVNPGAIVSGDVRVGTRTLVGAGSVILQGLTVGDDVIVGAAACVTKNVAAQAVVKGVPAR